MSVPQHVMISRLVRLANDLHAEGRADTAARRYATGVAKRAAANAILRNLELPLLDYHGRPLPPAGSPSLQRITPL